MTFIAPILEALGTTAGAVGTTAGGAAEAIGGALGGAGGAASTAAGGATGTAAGGVASTGGTDILRQLKGFVPDSSVSAPSIPQQPQQGGARNEMTQQILMALLKDKKWE